MSMNAGARLYPAAIALVSGTYSIGTAFVGGMGTMPMNDSVMFIVGIAVIAHGIALLTPLAQRRRRTSGPLMIVWAAIMLANQLLAATTLGSMMRSWDAGMVALALLMLASGLIMTRGGDAM